MKGDTLVNKTAVYNIIQCQKIKENFFLRFGSGKAVDKQNSHSVHIQSAFLQPTDWG